ncbi:dnaJ homolog subfamily C member 9-like [Acanthaster planci]|uniref:DnaJ homolog subfamily C member 9-like n=1 Tax=Acanthaster planci TaxID=133434 RepID=A0A8B7ZKY5_ACAPL|nr:dnaJ homolog subfamily C member 9-like [Acanthaster planci]
MPALLDSCEELFGTRDLYEILAVGKSASSKEVKRGYYKLSLKVHPDRVSSDAKEDATKKFQALGRIYRVLSDTNLKALYDETGEVDDEIDTEKCKDWADYWRILFKKVSVNDIREFEKKYQGSSEELEDLKASYLECEGDMEQILENVLCCTHEDEPRFAEILTDLINRGELPEYEAFMKESKKQKSSRRKKAKREAEEAERLSKELGLGKENGDDALTALIKQRQQSREQQMDNFMAGLEAKYCNPQPKGKKGKAAKKK